MSSSLIHKVRVLRSFTKTPAQITSAARDGYRLQQPLRTDAFLSSTERDTRDTSTMGPVAASSRAQHCWSIWVVEEEVIVSQHLASIAQHPAVTKCLTNSQSLLWKKISEITEKYSTIAPSPRPLTFHQAWMDMNVNQPVDSTDLSNFLDRGDSSRTNHAQCPVPQLLPSMAAAD